MIETVELDLDGKKLRIETGRLARQAGGSVLVSLDDTVILATATISRTPREGIDFFPLMVDYREKAYAAGKIPGGFFKREGRMGEKETISARQIDRPIRPLFPKGLKNDVQVDIAVLSSDKENDADVLGVIGAGAALGISNIPFSGPVAAVRIGHIDGSFRSNPSFFELEDSMLNLIVAGTEDSLVMVEGSSYEVSEELLVEGLKYAHEQIRKIVDLQKQLIEKTGKEKIEVPPVSTIDDELASSIDELVGGRLKPALLTEGKLARDNAVREVTEGIYNDLIESHEGMEAEISAYLESCVKSEVRQLVFEEGRRVDGRKENEIRDISGDVNLLPRTHGSALFTRGETQSLVVVTLGTKIDEKIVDDLEGEYKKSYMLHYNFPGYSVGETRPNRGPGRREIGHGVLAERSLLPIIPSEDDFPYTIRLVSEILESNGSSSMASVCGGSLALMDAGVPVKSAVAGIAMGLFHNEESGDYRILSDILGMEDHLGDMDFKVAGTRDGVTALQMDIKIKGLSLELMTKALHQAREGRMTILDKMHEIVDKPRGNLSDYAPKIVTLKVDTERIRDIIGPGGKTIRKITAETGATIDVDDTGKVSIASVDQASGNAAVDYIKQLTAEPEIGMIYRGIVKKITSFGAFVEYLPNKDGLVRISNIERRRINRVEDVLQEGDETPVKLIGIDRQGRVELSRKDAMSELGKKHQE